MEGGVPEKAEKEIMEDFPSLSARDLAYARFRGQWIYVLIQGSYSILRSPQGWIGEQIVFSGLVTMIGITCEWRMTWTKTGNDQFGFVNEERNGDGSWDTLTNTRLIRKQ